MEYIELFHALFENSRDSIFIMKGNYFVDCNNATSEMFGVQKEEIIGQTPFRFSPEIQPDGEKSIDKAKRKISDAQKGIPQFFEWKHKKLDGTLFDTEVSLSKLDIPEENMALAIVRDISSKNKAIEQLKEKEETFRALAENSTDVIMRFDKENRHLYVNPAVELQTGIPPDKFIGKTHEELGFPKELCFLWKNVIQTVFNTKLTQRIEFQLPTGFWIDWIVVPEFDQNKQVKAVITSARDITSIRKNEKEREHLQEELQQSVKMEAIGHLAGGIAHDFNNILTGIIGNVQLILMDMNPLDPFWKNIEDIGNSAELASKLTKQLLTFSRKQHINLQIININTIISNLQDMIKRTIGEDINLAFQLDKNINCIKIDRGQFEQILLNLIVNAKDAMKNGGKLIIETKNIKITNQFSKLHPNSKEGDFVCLSVSDSGIGMTEEIQNHLFEPFFTTKPIGYGTGLGLSIVYGIVKNSNGFIEIYSKPNQGTTFEIYFPTSEEKDTFSDFNKQLTSLIHGNERILFVEDDQIVRDLITNILNRIGYEVREASNGNEAINLIQSAKSRFNLLITDIVMPIMNGIQLASEIKKMIPDIKILFLSGYTEKIIDSQNLGKISPFFLEKPFTPQQLTSKIREILAYDGENT